MKILILLCIVCLVKGQLNFGGLAPKRPSLGSLGQVPASLKPGGLSNIAGSLPVKIPEVDLSKGWSDFQGQFKKAYSAAEETLRKTIFKESIEKVTSHNEEFAKGLWSFAEKLNPFSDLKFPEFNQLLNGFNRLGNLRKHLENSKASAFVPSATTIPETVDWREAGAVSPIKNQMQCAACYAFAAAGALEGQIFRKTGKLQEISPQNLIDCPGPRYGIGGCKEGGLVETSYDYVTDNGIAGEGAYPYESKDGECRYKPETAAANCTGYARIPQGDEKSLENAVATLGPISVAIHVVPRFQFYAEGVFFSPECKNTPDDLNHAVLLVGYGKEPGGQKYWLLKNSYGPEWGIEGYFKLAKDSGNHCGVATYANYPLV